MFAPPLALLALLAFAPADEPGSDDAGGGVLSAVHRYARGPHNPGKHRMFRVNAPHAGLLADHGGRSEAKANGLMLVPLPHDPRTLAGVRLGVSLWAGHPGTAGRRVAVNGRSVLPLPGPPDGDVGHAHLTLPLKRSDVVNGWNALQFACDAGSAFWGHFVVDSAWLIADLPPDHPAALAANLDGFAATPAATVDSGNPELLRLSLGVPERFRGRVSGVLYEAEYTGFDENGADPADARGEPHGRERHGFLKDGDPGQPLGYAAALVGADVERAGPSFAAAWDRSLIPDQPAGEPMRLRAIVLLDAAPNASGRNAGQAADQDVDQAADQDNPPGWEPEWRYETAPINLPPLSHRGGGGRVRRAAPRRAGPAAVLEPGRAGAHLRVHPAARPGRD